MMKHKFNAIMKGGLMSVGKGRNKVVAWSNTAFMSDVSIDTAMSVVRHCMRNRLPIPNPMIERARFSDKFSELHLAGHGYSHQVYRDPNSEKIVPVLDENKQPILDELGVPKTRKEYQWKFGNPSADNMHDDILTNVVTTEMAVHIHPSLAVKLPPTVDFPPLPEVHPISVLRRYGFTVGDRDSRVNTEFEGTAMITDGDPNGFSIVGDISDIEAMAEETVSQFELESRYVYVPVEKARVEKSAENHYRLDPVFPPDDIWPEYFADSESGKPLPEAAVEPRIEAYESLSGAKSAIAFKSNMAVLRIPAVSDLEGWIKVDNDSSFRGDRRYITSSLSLENGDILNGDQTYTSILTAYPEPKKSITHEP